MRKVIVTMFVTLDGVMESPQEWCFPFWNDEIAQLKKEELFAADAHLLGRVTYESFAAAWPSRTDDGTGFTDRMNALPKFVVSKTLTEPVWQPATVIANDLVGQVSALKNQPGENILVSGSATLVQTLVEHDLVDKFCLLVFPVVVGKGKRLFSEGSQASLTLTETRAFGSGVVLLKYQCAPNNR